MPQSILITVPLRRGRIDKMRIEFVLSTSDRNQAMSTNSINLIYIVNLSILILLLLRAHTISSCDQVLQVNIRQCQALVAGTPRGKSNTLSLPSSLDCKTHCLSHLFPSVSSILTFLSTHPAHHRHTPQSLPCLSSLHSHHNWRHWRRWYEVGASARDVGGRVRSVAAAAVAVRVTVKLVKEGLEVGMASGVLVKDGFGGAVEVVVVVVVVVEAEAERMGEDFFLISGRTLNLRTLKMDVDDVVLVVLGRCMESRDKHLL
ncbi:hypothetical protein RJ641_004933 [Dillenia turbinata]|uniref:Uncharacterized protein n=1 Tax=Dillenia turbinata TaxID=194707 RepID=A0AAN8ZCL0_9MAGN